MEKEEPIEICRVANGFIVRPPLSNLQSHFNPIDLTMKSHYVFRTLTELFEWVSDEHFTSPSIRRLKNE